MDFYKTNIPVLDEAVPADRDHLFPANQARGLVPRDYSEHPELMFAPPDQLQLIPESEWDARYDEQEATESSLEHLYLRGGQPAFVNLDQNGFGYCWAFSTAQSIMIDRLKQGLPLVRLSGYATAAIIKGGRDEGGWCGLSAKWARENGYAEEGTGPGQWPFGSRAVSNDTPELRAKMAKYKIEEDFVDLTKQVYDQNLTRAQVATCGFLNIVGPRDYSWWSHSVCGMRWVRIAKGDWGQLILNSWKGWGRFGLAVLRGSQAICNGGLAVRLTSATAV